MVKKRITLEIMVDEKKVVFKYNNFLINWGNDIAMFMEHLAKSFEEKHLTSFGYSVRIVKDKNWDNLKRNVPFAKYKH